MNSAETTATHGAYLWAMVFVWALVVASGFAFPPLLLVSIPGAVAIGRRLKRRLGL